MRTDGMHSESTQMGQHGVKRNELINVLAGINEADPEILPPYMKHPPSPPVRLRSRYENFLQFSSYSQTRREGGKGLVAQGTEPVRGHQKL